MNGSDIQVEKGNYTRIHNAILEALAGYDFTSREYACILYLLRMTYGYSRKECRLSYGDFRDATGIDPAHVSRAMKRLVECSVVIKTDARTKAAATWSFNKYFEQWTIPHRGKTIAERAIDTIAVSAIDEMDYCQKSNSSIAERAIDDCRKSNSYISAKESIKEIKDNAPGGYFGLPDPRRATGGAVSAQTAEARKLGVEPTQFREMTDALIDAAGWRAAVDDVGDDAKLAIAKDNALALVRMGHTTGEQVRALAEAYRAATSSWRKTPPQPRDLVTHASQIKQGFNFSAPTNGTRGEPAQKWMFNKGGDE